MPLISPGNNFSSIFQIFHIEPKNQLELIEAVIENSKKVMEKKQGFVSTSLHKSFDGTSVANYSQWENRKSYEDAINFLNPNEVKIGEKIFDNANSDWNIYELVFSAGETPTKISKNVHLITIINIFSVKPENHNRLLQLLVKLRFVVEKLSGFISANVHKNFKGNRIISYAQWKTKENYQAVYTNSQAIPILDEIKKISKFSWNLYEVVYTTD